jgi:hypothetical protein
MFISTNDSLINTAHITNAHYEPAKEADNPDDWDADENGVLPEKLTVYFPVASSESDYGCSSQTFTGEAATKIWDRLRLENGSLVLSVPSRQPINREAKRRKREEARAALVAECPAIDLPF